MPTTFRLKRRRRRGTLNRRDHFENPDGDGKILLKRMLRNKAYTGLI
jgi:hypothetical protein